MEQYSIFRNFTFKAYKVKSSHITTDGQSGSLSWCQAPISDLWPKFLLLYLIIFFRQLQIYWCGALWVTSPRVGSTPRHTDRQSQSNFDFKHILLTPQFFKIKHCPIITLKSINKVVSYNVKITNGYSSQNSVFWDVVPCGFTYKPMFRGDYNCPKSLRLNWNKLG
jgi:hypothetical protein